MGRVSDYLIDVQNAARDAFSTYVHDMGAIDNPYRGTIGEAAFEAEILAQQGEYDDWLDNQALSCEEQQYPEPTF